MVFSSIVFLSLFFPVVIVLHTAVKNNVFRNVLLLIASLLFYAYGENIYILILLISALINYIMALVIDRRKRKWLLVLTIILNLGILCFFKYTGFIVANVNSLLNLDIKAPDITMPIGISFFTFQALSYVVDVYRRQVPVQKDYAKLLLYISFFPQLIAGPIVRYKDIAEEIDHRTVTADNVAFGLRRFIAGLAKKVLIANTMGACADFIFNSGAEGLNICSAWIGAVSYLMQIYFDFSGYSDMAIGLGKMFGFHFKENFNHPYTAVSIQDFWRRWHISLSTWFRDYVYIPLGGNRTGQLNTVINRMIVFFLTGLWHGANWTFVVWGLYHGMFLLIEAFVPKLKSLPKAAGHIYTLLVVTVGFVIFRADTLGEAVTFISRMFSGFTFDAAQMSFALRAADPFTIIMAIAAVLSCGTLERFTSKVSLLEDKDVLTKRESAIQTTVFLCAILALIWCIIRLTGSSYNPFIYFRF